MGCEAFKKESDLVEKDGKKVCPDHLTPCQELIEQNWFFKLSAYEKQVQEWYDKHEDFVQPSHRYNEVLSFVKG
ncbi:MAG: class I tRNA ligase family protein [bacterium]